MIETTCCKCGSNKQTVIYRISSFKYDPATYRNTTLSNFDVRKYSEHSTWYECRNALLEFTCTTCGYRWFSRTLDEKDK